MSNTLFESITISPCTFCAYPITFTLQKEVLPFTEMPEYRLYTDCDCFPDGAVSIDFWLEEDLALQESRKHARQSNQALAMEWFKRIDQALT